MNAMDEQKAAIIAASTTDSMDAMRQMCEWKEAKMRDYLNMAIETAKEHLAKYKDNLLIKASLDAHEMMLNYLNAGKL